ncbi:hypothetical protein [Aeromonas caviae]
MGLLLVVDGFRLVVRHGLRRILRRRVVGAFGLDAYSGEVEQPFRPT